MQIMKAIRKNRVCGAGVMEDLKNMAKDSGLYRLGNMVPLNAHVLLSVL